jgi:hypothetical protein
MSDETPQIPIETPAKGIRGRRRVVNVGEWLTRSQIALRSGIDRETVSKYLGMADAPKPDKKMRFHYKQAMEWIGKTAPRVASGNNEEMRTLREALLRMDVEARALELGVTKGQFIERAKIRPGIENVMGRLTVDLQSVLEEETPPKLVGKNVTEIRQIIAAALDRVLKRVKEGWGQIA